MGCAITGSAAGTNPYAVCRMPRQAGRDAAGASFDLLLEAAEREKIFIPMCLPPLGSLAKALGMQAHPYLRR